VSGAPARRDQAPARGQAARGQATLAGWAERRASTIAAILPLGWLAVFFLAPLGFVVVYSFANATFGGVELGFTWTNFHQALSGFYLGVFLHTLIFASTGSLLCLAVGLPVAYVLGRMAGRYRTLLLALLLIPYWTSFLIRTLSWETLMAPGGAIQDLLNALRLHHGTLNLIDTNTAVFIGIVYDYLPLMIIPLFVAFERIPASALDASKDLGAGRLRTFANVTLPLARPGLVTAIILTFVPMTGEYVVPALLGGGKGVLMGGLISSQFLQAADYPLGSAMAVLVLAVLTVVVAVLTRVSRGFAEVPA
jgi:spermidine/putrescine transport system permease protein